MCQVSMNGMPSPPEYAEIIVVDNLTGKAEPELITVPSHSKCVATRGSSNYFCQCQKPFAEDLTIEQPNCKLQIGSCDAKLCLHGSCVTTTNRQGKALCMCYAGYGGHRCDKRVRVSLN